MSCNFSHPLFASNFMKGMYLETTQLFSNLGPGPLRRTVRGVRLQTACPRAETPLTVKTVRKNHFILRDPSPMSPGNDLIPIDLLRFSPNANLVSSFATRRYGRFSSHGSRHGHFLGRTTKCSAAFLLDES